MRRTKVYLLAAIAAFALSACGGGGGDSTTDAPGDAISVNLTGEVAKGRVVNGTVTVHQIDATGLPVTPPVATGTTDANGRYALQLQALRGQPLVIVVSGNANSTHLDEVTNTAQSLPASFRMRAVVANPTGTATVTVTPFSEMAVAAAEKASGGLTASNIASGNSVVAQLLGFSPTGIEIKSTTGAATADEQKLALMLTAVSQMAATGGAGCTTGTAGDKTACVVNALSGAATITSLQLNAGGVNLGPQIVSAINAVLQEPRLAGNVSSAVLATILNNLGCTGASCTPTQPPPPAANPTAARIAAARALFTELKSDWTALFVSGQTAGVGDANAQATKFADALDQVQAPAEMMLKDSSMMVLGVDLYNDYKAGRTTFNGVSRAPGEFETDAYFEPTLPAVGCGLYQDAGITLATSPSNANVIACSARYFYKYDMSVGATEYSHVFLITPVSTAPGQFTYSGRARYRVNNGPSQYLPTQTVAGRTGTLVATTGSGGHITAFTANGEMPAAFKRGGTFSERTTALVGDHNEVSITGTRVAGTATATTSFSGTVKVLDSAKATLGTLAVSSGRMDEVAVSGGYQLSGAGLALSWTSPSATFSGSFDTSENKWSKDQTSYLPTKVVLGGKLSTTTSGVTTDFLTGTLTVTAVGYENYSPTLPDTLPNSFTLNAVFSGTVTAPSRPVLEVSLGTSMRNFQKQPGIATLQYRSLVAGTPKMTVSVSASEAAGVRTYILGESSAGLAMTVRTDAASADLVANGNQRIGILDLNNGILSFTDGTFMSVELAR